MISWAQKTLGPSRIQRSFAENIKLYVLNWRALLMDPSMRNHAELKTQPYSCSGASRYC